MTSGEFRDALDNVGLSQRDLAQAFGVEVSTVNRWATGRAAVPQYASAFLGLLRERAELLLSRC